MIFIKNIIAASFFLCVLCSSSVSNATDVSVKFSDEKVNEAIKRASAEGKLVFMDFYASWCTPCKWMDKTTFRSPKVIKALRESFIPVKINIDNTEGFAAKNRYNVNYLPTILILNSKGQLVERIEETLDAEKLVQLLSVHDHPKNKRIIKHAFNTSPYDINKNNADGVDPWKISKEDYDRYKSEKRRSYKVQVGMYESFAAAQKKVNALREIFVDPIVVINDYRDNKVLFKVMLGQFGTIGEATSFVKLLREQFDIAGIVY